MAYREFDQRVYAIQIGPFYPHLFRYRVLESQSACSGQPGPGGQIGGYTHRKPPAGSDSAEQDLGSHGSGIRRFLIGNQRIGRMLKLRALRQKVRVAEDYQHSPSGICQIFYKFKGRLQDTEISGGINVHTVQ